MILAHEGSDGFWVATSQEVAKYLGYPEQHFGSGFIAGRWLGASTQLGTFATIEEAIAAEPSVPNRTVDRGNPSNALGQHLASLAE